LGINCLRAPKGNYAAATGSPLCGHELQQSLQSRHKTMADERLQRVDSTTSVRAKAVTWCSSDFGNSIKVQGRISLQLWRKGCIEQQQPCLNDGNLPDASTGR